MIRVEVPGSSFMLCLGPGPPSLLHLRRANAEKPYAGDTTCNLIVTTKILPLLRYLFYPVNSNLSIQENPPDFEFGEHTEEKQCKLKMAETTIKET
jgi:hypothetical protein